MTPSSVVRRQVAVGWGELSVLEAGPADGEPVLLLHGIPASAELWRSVLPGLARAGYHAIAPDLPGYGQTVLPAAADHSLAAAAELLADALASESLGPVWLVGHDLGGAVAQILVTTRADMVSRLTLGDTVVADNWPIPAVRMMRVMARAGIFPLAAKLGMVTNPYSRAQLRRGFADPHRLGEDDARRVFWDRKVGDWPGRQAFARHLAALDPAQTVAAASLLGDITVPTQLVWGREDRFQPWEQSGQQLVEALPNPEVVVIEDAGHFVPLERPQAYLEALLAWRRGR